MATNEACWRARDDDVEGWGPLNICFFFFLRFLVFFLRFCFLSLVFRSPNLAAALVISAEQELRFCAVNFLRGASVLCGEADLTECGRCRPAHR